MGKIKNNSQGKKRNPLGVLITLLLIGFSTLLFTPIQLYAQSYTLNVTISGNGNVWSQVAGIDCLGDCSETYDSGTVVTLTAAPAENYYFSGWTGDCISQALTCKVTMDDIKTVTANFTTTPPPVTTWAKTYGGSNYETARSIQHTSDGGYIVAGNSVSFGVGNGDIWILKLLPNGIPEWQKTYGGSGGDAAYSIQQTSDGGYVVAGSTDSFAY